mgnify:CR=1 FL=1
MAFDSSVSATTAGADSEQTLSQSLHEIAQGAVRFKRMPKRNIQIDGVMIATPFAGLGNNAAQLEFAKNAKDGAFGDAHLDGQFANEDIRLAQEGDDGVGVVGQKGPTDRRLWVRSAPHRPQFRASSRCLCRPSWRRFHTDSACNIFHVS